jgi:hypothetical protein
MTKIRATCPSCGNVEFGIQAIVVVSQVHPSTPATYRFECPCCERPVLRTAEPEIIDLLLSVGVLMETRRIPLEQVSSSFASLPAFTLSDVDRFHDELNEPGWLERLQQLDR